MIVLAEWSSRGNWCILSPLDSIQRWAEARNSPSFHPSLTAELPYFSLKLHGNGNGNGNGNVTSNSIHPLPHRTPPWTPPWHRCAEWSCTSWRPSKDIHWERCLVESNEILVERPTYYCDVYFYRTYL